MDVEIGQVLSLIIRFNNRGEIAKSKHPYLVVDIDIESNVVEIAQIDSLKGKEFKALFKSNCVIYKNCPDEKVIDKDSYLQMDNIIKIDNFDGLNGFRRQFNKLSQEKLKEVLIRYREYQRNNRIDEDKQVYINQEELENLNK